jgi:hypothetical protein
MPIASMPSSSKSSSAGISFEEESFLPFSARDALGYRGGDTNLYRYCGNSPTNATDPTGLMDVRPGSYGENVVLGQPNKRLVNTAALVQMEGQPLDTHTRIAPYNRVWAASTFSWRPGEQNYILQHVLDKGSLKVEFGDNRGRLR